MMYNCNSIGSLRVHSAIIPPELEEKLRQSGYVNGVFDEPTHLVYCTPCLYVNEVFDEPTHLVHYTPCLYVNCVFDEPTLLYRIHVLFDVFLFYVFCFH